MSASQSSPSSSSSTVEAIVQQCGFLPMVGILSSAGADAICKKDNLTSFADLVLPFSSVSCVIKDPFGQQQSIKVKLDFRDVAKSGCLWSLTVLPSVLHQIVASISSLPENSTTDVWSAAFRDAFCYWLEPSENDFFKTYLCCIFVISAEEEDPLGELKKLIQQQNNQQHGGTEAANSLGPAHCAPPKWFLPNILKHYVVLHDVNEGTEEKANEVFSKIVSTYGSDCCHILKINSTSNDADLPDPWQQILDQKYRGLDTGLEMARKKIIEKTASADNLISADTSKLSSLMPISTPSSTTAFVFSTSSAAASPTVPLSAHYPLSSALPHSINEGISPGSSSIASFFQPRTSHGQCLTTSDREQIRDFVEKFVKQSLVPFVEKQITAQNDILQNRRGIGIKSFTSMKKWLSMASTTTASTPQQVSYGAESAEIQTRRLADMAFLFGMYPFAHQLYQSIKKDFSADQAWLYQAGALEMAALTLYLSSTQLTPKQFPLHYFDNALNFYHNTCLQPMLAVRCAIISVEVLSRIGMHLEAANHLIRLTSTLTDLFSGVLLEKASCLFQLAKNFRRKAFHLILAGHRFNQAQLPTLSLKCYDQAAAEYSGKGWHFAEDHIMFTLSHESKNVVYQADCATKLLRPGSFQFMDQQAAFIDHYLRILSRNETNNPLFIIPQIKTQEINIIYGEKPDVLTLEDDEKVAANKEWEDLERAAWHAGIGSKKGFTRICPLFSTAYTKNRDKKETPPFERFRVQLKMINPMNVPLVLRNIRLGIKEIGMREGFVETDAFIEHGTIPELILPATELPVKPEMTAQPYPSESETLIELHLTPSDKLHHFSISSVLFDLCGASGAVLSGHLPLEVKGPRLTKTKEQRMKKVYGPDHRLDAIVSPDKWPLLNVELSGQAARSSEIHAYSSQMFQVYVNFENIGDVSISALTIASDQPEFVAVSEPSIDDNQKWSLCAAKTNPNGVLVHIVDQKWISSLQDKNGKLTLRMAIKAPDDVVENYLYRILFFYIGKNGNIREFRYNVKMTTQPLLRCIPRVLKDEYQLCAIDVKNLIPNRDTVLAKVEVLRISSHVTVSKKRVSENINIGMELVLKRQVVVECDQSDIIPFFIKMSPDSPSTIWFTDIISDIPAFSNMVPHYISQIVDSQQQQNSKSDKYDLPRAHIRFNLLWRAQIANTDGTMATLFGETWVVNPFSVRKLSKFLTEPILDERVYFSTGIPNLDGHYGIILLEQDRRSILAAKMPGFNSEEKKIIHYKEIDADDIDDMDKENYSTQNV